MPEVTDPRLLSRLNSDPITKRADSRPADVVAGQGLSNAKNAADVANAPLDRTGKILNNQGQGLTNQRDLQNIGFDRAKTASQLYEGFRNDQVVKAYREVLPNMAQAMQAGPGGAGANTIIYAWAKAMDPIGSVREGDVDLAAKASPIWARAKNLLEQVKTGNGLPDQTRHDLVEEIRNKARNLNLQYTQVRNTYEGMARDGGIPPTALGPHEGDSFRAIEEKYIKEHGGVPHSSYAPTVGFEAAPPDAKTRTVINQERSAFIDAMIRGGVPFESAQDRYRNQFPGAPVFSDPSQYDKALKFARAHPNVAGSFGRSEDTVALSPLEQSRNQFGQSGGGAAATLGVNALTGGIPSLLAGHEGAQTIGLARDRLGTAGSLAVEIPATVAGTLALGGGISKGAGLLKDVPGFGRLVGDPVARNIASDMVFGSTFGASERPDNPLGGAVTGAGLGLLGNQVGSRVLGPGLRAGGAALGFNPAPALERGQNLIAGQVGRSDPGEVIARLQAASDLNMPFALVDASPQLRALGGSVVRKSPDALAIANQSLGNRTLGQVDRLAGMIGDEFGPRLNLPTFKESARATAQKNSRDLYTRAYGHAAPDDPTLNDMLHTPAGEQAARNAYATALNRGEKPGDLSFEVDSITGQPRVSGRPNWKTLHYMKMELDQMPEADSLRRRFVGRLGSLNKDYRKANLEYSKEVRRGDIAQAGYDAFNPNVRAPELGADIARPMNAKNPQLYRQGYGTAMADRALGMRDTANPFELAQMASPDQMAKMETIAPNFADRFRRARGIENEMSLTNRELFGGSPTQPRAEADKLFDEGGFLGDVTELGLGVATGTPPINLMRSKLFAGRGLFKAAQEKYNYGIGRTAQHRALEMAPMLFDKDPTKAMAALDEMLRQKAARDAYVRRTGLLGSSVAAPTAITLSGNR